MFRVSILLDAVQVTMGKKVKKKVKSGSKEKRGASTPPTIVPQDATSNGENPANGAVVVKDRGVCSHIDKGISLEKLSAKLKSSESTKCEDCRGNVADRRAKKGQSKQGKKGGSKSETRAIWVCLECGHFACGGVGFPTTPQSHAVRHSKQHHHPLAVNYDNHQLLWCFPCDKIILAESSEHKEALNEVVKLLKGQPGEGSTADVEDVWFGSGSVTSAMKLDYSVSSDGKGAHSIRGLSNLGNTCFFNSVTQNLLALNRFRDYFLKLDETVGPLSAAMRKLFLETSSETNSKGVINPRSLFGSLCTKAPQFRGFQQHDSHELLRCLLDGMSTEELSFRKHSKSCEVSVKDPTFVDVVFGGQLSSTVSCLECGHSSTIYEPFLDLSLPVPTKKPPPRKNQPPIRGKKPKLPPRRSARNLSKISRGGNSLPRKSVSDQSTSGNGNHPSGEVHSTAQPEEKLALALCENAVSNSTDPNNVALEMGLSAEDLSTFQNPQDNPEDQAVTEQQAASSDAFTWLDYLDPTPSENDDFSGIHDNATEDVHNHDVSSSVASDSRIDCNLENLVPEAPVDNSKVYDAPEDGAISQEQNASPQVEDEQTVKPKSDERILPEGTLTEDRVECDGDKDHQTSPSCSQVCAEDSNTEGRDNENSSQIPEPIFMSCQNREAATSSAEAEISSVIAGNEQDSIDFDGFGDMFNEPEEFSGDKPSVVSDIAINGANENTSESDADEVDNADAPVTVESCLAFFMKPEFLSKDEHAWQCDNCSKILREERMKLMKAEKPVSDTVPNGCEDRLLDDGKSCDTVKSMNANGEVDKICENGKCEVQNHVEAEINEAGPSECSNLSNQSVDPRQGEWDYEKDDSVESDSLPAKPESGVKENKDVESENLKVRRDATKSILISKAPAILTIHLKRFSQDPRGRLSKLNGHVSFRETIDLKSYMQPRSSFTSLCSVFQFSLLS